MFEMINHGPRFPYASLDMAGIRAADSARLWPFVELSLATRKLMECAVLLDRKRPIVV